MTAYKNRRDDIVHGCRQLAFLREQHGHSSRQQFVICFLNTRGVTTRQVAAREKKASRINPEFNARLTAAGGFSVILCHERIP